MADFSPIDAFRELVSRGRLAATPAPRPLPVGNVDRRDLAARSSWQAALSDGRSVRVTLGARLGDLARRHSALAAALPDLIPAPVFHESLANSEAFACVFFPGESLETLARENPAAAQAATARVCTSLASSEKPSTESARLDEWRDWTTATEGRAFWTAAERQLLRETIWPRLYPLLTTQPPGRRWTNGDFTSANILADPAGTVRLIDSEFATATHFFLEDAVRFQVLSPAAREQPGLFAAALPPAGPAWHLYFWLRQLGLEFDQNTPAYFARFASVRLAVIRRLAEQLFGVALTGWSVPAIVLHEAVETARWDNTSVAAVRLAGWCHAPGAGVRRVVATQNDRLLAATAPLARPDVQAHFGGGARALATGFDWVVPLPQRDDAVILSIATDDGTQLPFHSFRPVDLPGRRPWLGDYPRWALRHDADPAPPTTALAGPRFSILLPVFNTPPALLRACLASVRRQHHPHWELVVVDDASTHPEARAVLQEFAAAEPRISLHFRPANGGIARATNDALAAATGEFVVLLDHDDLLRPHALAELARELDARPEFDALYSDEDKITEEGTRAAPFLKPDFSPEFLLGVMYVGHVLCVRTTVARAAGGFDPAFDGVQDYEFLLRVTEHTRRIGHVPWILYHWRQSAASSALHGNVKGDMDARQARAVQAHLGRRGRTEQVQSLGGHRVGLEAHAVPCFELIHSAPGTEPLVELQQAATRSTAVVFVVLAFDPTGASERWAEELAAAAALPDSGLCAPLLLSREGWVLESGRTRAGLPIMRGFDPRADGYNGSLPCRREVDGVAPLCFAVRRELLPAAAGESWPEFSARLSRTGFFHRLCPAARLQTTTGWQEPVAGGSPAGTNAFLNPLFDATRADYSLADWPPRTP